MLTTLGYWGTCASVGNAGSFKLETTVLPFLLRGINLCGIDSATCPKDRRLVAWDRSVQAIADGQAGFRNQPGRVCRVAGPGGQNPQGRHPWPLRDRRQRLALALTNSALSGWNLIKPVSGDMPWGAAFSNFGIESALFSASIG